MNESPELSPTSLWIRIKNFDIDGGPSSFPFVKKLAVENGWSIGFAERVVEEYRRFTFLAMVTGQPVTPSVIVDEAWHLHLTYTHSYWERFVKEVLPKPLHHHPTKGGAAEDAKHANQYLATLDAYERFFEQRPPEDIWPIPGKTNLAKPAQKREEYWFVSKRKAMRLGQALVATVAVVGVAAGCQPLLAQSAISVPLLWAGLAAVGILVIGILFVAMRGAGDEGGLMQSREEEQRHRQDGSSTSYAGGCGSSDASGHHGHDGHDGDSNDGGDSGGDGGGDGGGSCGSGCGGGCGS